MWKCVERLTKYTPEELYEPIFVEQGHPYLAPDPVHWDMNFPLGGGLYLHSSQPLGYARAVNLGVALARTEFICIINNDLFVPPGWLETMLAEFASIPHCGVLAPFDGPEARLDPNGPVIYDQSWWSCVLMRREHFNNIEGLNDRELNYRFHDQDFNIRTRLEGLRIARTGKVVVEHIDSATYSRMPERVEADTKERAVMIERWGAAHYVEWLAKGGMEKR